VRRVWAPRGERPIASVHHRYEWLYLYSFVHPLTGQTESYIIPRVNIEWFNLALESFALAVGAGKDKIILLVIDRAGWHMSDKVVVPEGIYLEPLLLNKLNLLIIDTFFSCLPTEFEPIRFWRSLFENYPC
jgi:hypothetical protein